MKHDFHLTSVDNSVVCGVQYRDMPTPDNVNHPRHYETGKYECIDVMTETQGKDAVYEFCICNAFKYLYRHRRKNNVEDIKKAIWYLNKAIELHDREEANAEETENK